MMATAPLDHFNQNLDRARALCVMAKSLGAVVTSAVDLSDIFRASLVLGVSALDHFIHEFVRIGMLEVHRGIRSSTDAHLNFKITLGAARAAIAAHPTDDWLDEAIREAHSWLSFQQPEKIADAVRLVSATKLWDEIGKELGSSSAQAKLQLTVIVDRRNKIAHEADLDPTSGLRWPIDEQLVSDALTYLERVAHAVSKVAN